MKKLSRSSEKIIKLTWIEFFSYGNFFRISERYLGFLEDKKKVLVSSLNNNYHLNGHIYSFDPGLGCGTIYLFNILGSD